MERYAGSTGCRHRHLVSYFGQPYERQDCGACDVCLEELEPVQEPIVLARKILSCVARVGQRFGAAHVTNVLRGAATDQVSARRHDALTTFGLLRDASVGEIRGYIEQLCALALLRQGGDEFPVLELTNAGVELLKDAGSRPDLTLARLRRPTREKPARRSRVEAESWQDVDRDLFERLRALRLEIARGRGVPPYVIFHDSTLRELARVKPTTVEQLRSVYGVGARKAEDLGELFITAIRGGTP
jgi:ATP-dependent DNA helicase RecQ